MRVIRKVALVAVRGPRRQSNRAVNLTVDQARFSRVIKSARRPASLRRRDVIASPASRWSGVVLCADARRPCGVSGVWTRATGLEGRTMWEGSEADLISRRCEPAVVAVVQRRAGSNGIDIKVSRRHTVSVSNFQSIEVATGDWMVNF